MARDAASGARGLGHAGVLRRPVARAEPADGGRRGVPRLVRDPHAAQPQPGCGDGVPSDDDGRGRRARVAVGPRADARALLVASSADPPEFFARHIAGAELQELPTMRGEYTWVDDETHEATMGAVRGVRRQAPAPRAAGPRPRHRPVHRHRRLDRARRRRSATGAGATSLERHHAIVRGELARFARRARTTPRATASSRRSTGRRARSVRASRCVERVRELGIEIRAGVHTGECEVIDGKCAGLTVSIGARVASNAGRRRSSSPGP